MSSKEPRVLDVGQCNMDHGSIRNVLEEAFRARVDRAHSIDDALKLARDNSYNLILVNRILDADGTEGVTLIERIKADQATRAVPVMLVSNFEEAQAAAVQAGAERGFGKNALNAPDTRALLEPHIGRRAE